MKRMSRTVMGMAILALVMSATGWFGGANAYAFYAEGGNVTSSGVYRIHTFTNSGTFTVSEGGPMDVLVVAGGGSGGARVGGGGGAGGLAYSVNKTVTNGTYSVTVGNGGAAVTSVPSVGVAGNDGQLSAFADLTAVGGGGGGAYTVLLDTNAPTKGRDGGCGGGAGGYSSGTGGIGSQGYNGGIGTGAVTGGGGGGMGTIGFSGASGGHGGTGVVCSISGSNVYYCGGGGGSSSGAAGAGGMGGGGAGSTSSNTPATSGTPNTGGGGGGARDNFDSGGKVSGAGGSGIVIVRYMQPTPAGTVYTMR